MSDLIQIARDTILAPVGLGENDLDRMLGELTGNAIDAADLYFQSSRLESWVLEDGIIKEGSYSIEQGAGIRVISGDKTGFAYSDELQLPILLERAGSIEGGGSITGFYAVLIEGKARSREQGFDTLIAYVDYQTHLPLYLITRRNGGLIVDIGIPVHRYSGDVASYPNPLGTDHSLVFDPVAAVYYRAADGGSGWRRESYDVRSTAPSRSDLQEMITTDTLLRGR